MRQAERILEYVMDRCFCPAKQICGTQLSLRAGDIHKELGLSNRLPSVCSVLGSQNLQRVTQALLVARYGPQQGSNAVFVYDIQPR